MATPDGGDPSLQSPIPAGAGTCRWRTARYHDNECSRYFDCPTHLVERALSDSGQEPEEEHGEEHHEREEAGPVNAADRADPGAVSPLSEDGNENEGAQRGRSPSPDLPTAVGRATSAIVRYRRASQEAETQGERPGASADNPIILIDSSPVGPRRRAPSRRPEVVGSDSEDGDNGMPTAPVPSLTPRDSGTAAVSQAASRHATAPDFYRTREPRPSAIQPTGTERQGASEVVLPRWQPDAEVTYCPICHTQFSIFVRKHHCRKCGRVVCNACSPHRITIPYQYIVRPPGSPHPMAQRPPVSLLDNHGWYPEFGGGERVRLCNPCVPDPNTAPPQTQGVQTRSQSILGAPVPTDNNPISSRWSFYFGSGPTNDAPARNRSATMQPGAPSSSRPSGLPYPRNTESRILSGTPPAYYRPHHVPHAHRLYSGLTPRYRSMLDVGDHAGPSSAAGPSSSSSSGIHRRLPPLPTPQPQIPEEDECPVCHRELPPRTLPNFESLREAHINICIAAHSTYSGGSIPSSSSGTGQDGGGGGGSSSSPLPPVPPRRTGMFPYTATEKDCVDSAECSICLEEFEVGVPMARLECLCRFHRRCISAWWERHPGRCPMHQHDGFGY
ncbi:hypothetical protein VTK56DRAFT_4788 [Thermocarpiscus australiensis]